MQLMSDDDAAYSALLAQLLSDSAPARNARVHSWIEHQYDFVLSEHNHLPFASSRPPSPSPSSSLGAHRAYSIDRPDSPLLPRISSDRTSSPCPSYDALFFPSHPTDDDFEEQERVRALRFIVQEMAHWKSHAPRTHPYDKPLPAPPPSPASSLTHSSSSRAMRSRSSSTRISRLPSFTSTLSSDQSQPQEMPPPLPVSVIVHGEYQHDLILRHDGYLHKRDDSLQDAQYLCPVLDDKDSFQPSPTLSNFSCAFSRETAITSPYASSPASPTNVTFSPCSPEDIALPASPVEEDRPFFKHPVHERTPSSRSSHSLGLFTVPPPKTHVFPASPTASDSPPHNPYGEGALHPLRAARFATYSQSRWSVATTASLTPSTTEPPKNLDPRTPSKDKKTKSLKSPKKRVRLISLISRFSPGRNDPASTTSSNQTTDDVEYDSANDSDIEDKEKKMRKSVSKKSSLASLRASFTLSRASFSSQRPPLSSPLEEVPPLPMSPTITSSLADPAEVVTSSIPKPSLSRIPSRGILLNSLPPIPQSASTVTTFQSTSQLSVSDTSPHGSRASLASPLTNPNNGSRISLLPSPTKRTSLASAAGIEPVVSKKQVPASEAVNRTKSIFRLAAKPKSIKMPISPGTKEPPTPSRLPVAGNGSLPSPTTARSKIPQTPAKFNPPAKLATVIAAQSRQAPALASPGLASKLPTPPSRLPPKIPRSSAIPAHGPPSLSPSSKLPMPASTKSARVGTVKGFWKRQ